MPFSGGILVCCSIDWFGNWIGYGDVDIGYDDDNNAASAAGKYALLLRYLTSLPLNMAI